MGSSLLGGLLGGILGGGESKPQVVYQPAAVAPAEAAVEETEEGKRKAKQGRAALYETEGGVAGAELDPNQVKRRSTLLGN